MVSRSKWHRSTIIAAASNTAKWTCLAGVVVAFQANQLPNPLVEISVPGHPAYQVSARQTLKPHFPAAEPACFQRIPADAVVTIRIYDDKAGRKKQLLGEAQLPCKHVQVRPLQFTLSCLPSDTPPSCSGSSMLHMCTSNLW
jgi:hypothetical protein